MSSNVSMALGGLFFWLFCFLMLCIIYKHGKNWVVFPAFSLSHNLSYFITYSIVLKIGDKKNIV